MAKKVKRTERFVGSYTVPGRFSLRFRAFLKRRLSWMLSLKRSKAKIKKSKPFSDSSIVAKPFPDQKKSRVGVGPRLTKSGKRYDLQYSMLRRDLVLKKLPEKRVSTILAFCKNHYIKFKELPSMDDLKRLFRF